MEKKTNRIILGLAIALVAMGFFEFARVQKKEFEQQQVINIKNMDGLTVWYTDQNMEPYLEEAKNQFLEQEGVQIKNIHVSVSDYLQSIYEASIEQKEAPDVFLLRNTSLGNAGMRGLAIPSQEKDEICTEANFPKSALDAVTYHGRYLAYPLHFNTVCLLYNKDIFKKAPEFFSDITHYAENEQVPETVEKIFNWNINDHFYNSVFLGDGISFAGKTGDEKKLSENTEQMIEGLTSFYNVSQYFAIHRGEETVLADFQKGQTICILGDVNMVKYLEQAVSAGESKVNYGIAPVPHTSETVKSISPSYTEVVVVNGLSTKKSMGEQYAAFLTNDFAKNLYQTTGYFPCQSEETNLKLNELNKIYEQSKQFPKLASTEDLGMKLDVLFDNVETGLDIRSEYQDFIEQLKKRMSE